MVEDNNLLAICDECGSAYAATITNDGDVLPIGARNGCRCGGKTFSQIAKEDFDEAIDGN